MTSETSELSIVDLDEVSGGLRYDPVGASITPSIPIPPPVTGERSHMSVTGPAQGR
jgi:hypothetical protein